MNAETPDFSQLPLRDLHLPDAIGWWPVAPGWWMLLALLMLLSGIIWLVVRGYRQRHVRRAAFAELKSIEEGYVNNHDPLEFVRLISVLLRRIALSFQSREQVAGLSGEAWLKFLDQGVQQGKLHGQFSDGVGRALIEAPYNPNAQVEVEKLTALTKEWVARVTKGKSIR